MATRRETRTRRASMDEALRRACAAGEFSPGEMLPPVRELAGRYEVSSKVAWQSIQNLVDEGLLYTVPRGGTFVGKPLGHDSEPFLLTFPGPVRPHEYLGQIQIGFEERIAQLGGASLRLTDGEARELFQNGELPALAGVFRMASAYTEPWWEKSLPAVAFGIAEKKLPMDTIRYDDVDGGRQAARHLLAMGHTRIAFLALHTTKKGPQPFYWSREREAGWATAMEQAGQATRGLAFHPIRGEMDMGQHITQCDLARQAALDGLVQRDDITAVVAANIGAAQGFFAALREAQILENKWPAVLCFDDAPEESRAVVSYLRLPWDEVGRAAAQMLWERKTGQLSGEPQLRLVPMRLIPRLTCRPRWQGQASLTAPTSDDNGKDRE